MIKKTLIFLSLGLMAHAAIALPNKDTIQKQIRKIVPTAEVEEIKPSVVKNLFEVRSGANVFYVTENGDYAFYGHLLDLKNQAPQSITENSLKKARLSLINKLDHDTVISFKPKTTPVKHTITVFSDIDCGYCRKLHQEIPALNKAGIAVDYISFPRAGVGSDSFDKAVNVWCAKDKQQAMTDAKAGKTVGKATDANCNGDQIIKRHMQLVRDLDLRATPVIVLEDGSVLPGYMPAGALIEQINHNEGKA